MNGGLKSQTQMEWRSSKNTNPRTMPPISKEHHKIINISMNKYLNHHLHHQKTTKNKSLSTPQRTSKPSKIKKKQLFVTSVSTNHHEQARCSSNSTTSNLNCAINDNKPIELYRKQTLPVNVCVKQFASKISFEFKSIYLQLSQKYTTCFSMFQNVSPVFHMCFHMCSHMCSQCSSHVVHQVCCVVSACSCCATLRSTVRRWPSCWQAPYTWNLLRRSAASARRWMPLDA